MEAVYDTYCTIAAALNRVGAYLPQLILRAVLAWEFWLAGQHKLHGADRLLGLAHGLPAPLAFLPAGGVWIAAAWIELLGAVFLLLGFGTRIAAVVLMTAEATGWFLLHTAGGHGGDRPWLYLAMLAPLLFGGAGRLSLDYWIVRRI